MRTVKFVILFLAGFTQAKANQNIQGAATSAVTTYATMAAVNAVSSREYKANCSGANAMACVAAGLTALQTLSAGRQAIDTHQTVDQSACNSAFCDENGNPDPTGSGNRPENPHANVGGRLPTIERIVNDAQEDLQDLRGQGYQFNSDGSVSANGRNISAQDLANGSAAGTLGASMEDIAAVEAIRKKDLSKDPKFSKLLNQIASEIEGSGGGRKAKGGKGYDPGFDYAKLFAGLNANPGQRGVAGLSKKLGKDDIGIAQDNIFQIITRKYTTKKSELTP